MERDVNYLRNFSAKVEKSIKILSREDKGGKNKYLVALYRAHKAYGVPIRHLDKIYKEKLVSDPNIEAEVMFYNLSLQKERRAS